MIDSSIEEIAEFISYNEGLPSQLRAVERIILNHNDYENPRFWTAYARHCHLKTTLITSNYKTYESVTVTKRKALKIVKEFIIEAICSGVNVNYRVCGYLLSKLVVYPKHFALSRQYLLAA